MKNISSGRRSKAKYVNKELETASGYIKIFTVFMVLFGVLMVFDASVYTAGRSALSHYDRFYYVKLQIIWTFIAVVLAWILYNLNYKLLQRMSVFIMGGVLFLLVAILVIPLMKIDNGLLGVSARNGASRWIRVAGIPIQPAEFAKLGMIIYMASWLPKWNTNYKGLASLKRSGVGQKFMYFGILLIFVLGLVLLERDLGTAAIIGFVVTAVFFVSSEDKIHTYGTMALGAVAGILGLISASLASYRSERIAVYTHLLTTGAVLDPLGKGYQLQQILYAVGSGGWFGRGLGASRQKFGYLGFEAHTDSIIAVMLEETGLIGGLIFIALWLGFLYYGIKIVRNTSDYEAKLVGVGIVVWLFAQAMLNISANIGVIPLTGIPLPFLTYGGSAMIVNLAGIALLLNIAKQNKT